MKYFNKRGQVTAFVILGIVIVVIVALFFVGRQTIFLPTTTTNLNQELNDIEEHILDCLEKDSTPNANEIIKTIGLQGGYLNPGEDTFILYNDSRVSFLCYNIESDERCRNRALTITNMEEQINEAVKNSLEQCLDVEGFEQFKPYGVSAGTLNVKITIEDQSVIVELDYPIVLTANENRVSRNKFSKTFDYSLGDLYEVSQDIVDDETEFGTFDTLSYMALRQGEIRIYEQKPYPNKMFTVKKEDNDYLFRFAIEGEPK